VLVLSRHAGESVIIGDNEVVVTVLAIRGDIVSLGIDADITIPILRQELKERLDRERQDREEKGGAA
jgi:carbon storage regulator